MKKFYIKNDYSWIATLLKSIVILNVAKFTRISQNNLSYLDIKIGHSKKFQVFYRQLRVFGLISINRPLIEYTEIKICNSLAFLMHLF